MRAALVRLGLTAIAAAEFTDNGITNMNRLRAMTEDDLERFIKQLTRDNHGGAGLVIPFASQQHIHAIRFWANRMYILGVPYDIALVNEPLAEAWNESRKAEAEAAEAPDDLVKKPEPFKKDTKWRPWKESVVTYLHSKTGQAAIPLAYIVREFDQGIPGAIYSTVHEQLVNQAIHHGPEYNTNNGIVYDLLQSLTLNGPAWSWISGFQRSRNGRGAWKALIEYYEGDAMQMRSKQQCYDSIAKASYQGWKRNFDFSAYVAIHQQAHQDLARLGEPIPENKKVRDFLQGITDPQWNNIKLNVLSNPVFMNSFSSTINYMASAIDMISKNTASTTRQISEYNSGSSQRTGRGYNRGRGRGGRGGRNNRSGRGRGRNNNGSNQPTTNNDDRPITRSYSREEWQNLSQAEKNRVYRARERLETARTVAAMLREDSGNQDDVSTITGTVPQRIRTNNNPSQGNDNTSVAGATRSIDQVTLDNVSQAFNRRRINAYVTVERSIAPRREILSVSQSNDEIRQCRVELDSHADTCGVNNVARILEFHGQVAQVSGFSDSMTPMKDIPIVKAALAYDIPDTGEVVILIINQALYFDNNLSHILLNPNQMRSNNVTVDDVPRHLSSKSSHSIIVHDENLTLPLKLNGVISYFNARTPTKYEIENCPHIVLTSSEEWDPYSGSFAMREATETSNMIQISAFTTEFMEKADQWMLSNSTLASVKLDKKNLFIQEQQLANNWGIGLKDASNTLKATSQLFIRSLLHPIERRFRTKNTALRYNQLSCRFYSDTFFSSTKSVINNTCAQLFVTDFGYAKFSPMQSKSEAGFTLKELIQDVGIPKELHTDGAKELTKGIWKQVCQESGIKTTSTEKGSPWQNRTEVEIRELKRHA